MMTFGNVHNENERYSSRRECHNSFIELIAGCACDVVSSEIRLQASRPGR